MKRIVSALLASAVLAALVIVATTITKHGVPAVYAQGGCRLASNLKGNYGFTYSGFSANGTNGSAAFPVDAAGVGTFDGAGNFSATFVVSFNGSSSTGNPYTATYTVNSDCTGVLTSTTPGTDNFAFVIVSGGADVLATDISAGTTANLELKKQLQSKSVIVGDSIPMKALRQQIALMAPTNGRVLIYGESGTGKELVAHAIHAQSLRKDETFVEVNCAAIPEDLIESELFGHFKGSFPGAAADKEGKFHRAHGGTLFLDEVGDMSLKTQSKVLRTLEEQRFTPVGSDKMITVDVRVIASTNKDLEEEISRGNFREDLFYRLNVIPFFVPPLRERKEDIPLFARHFLKELAATYGRRPREITDDAIEVLMRYSWPGNVRELRNVIERIVIMNPTTTKYDGKHLPPLVYRDGGRRAPKSDFSTLHQARDAYERDYILKTLDQNHGNVSRTAEVLGLERSHLYRKMKTLGIAAKE